MPVELADLKGRLWDSANALRGPVDPAAAEHTPHASEVLTGSDW